MQGLTTMVRRIWSALLKAKAGFVWYVREFSGEAKYDHYLEHFASEHPGETPLTEREYWRMREEYDRKHPNTSCCCNQEASPMLYFNVITRIADCVTLSAKAESAAAFAFSPSKIG